MERLRRWPALVAVFAVLGLILGACGAEPAVGSSANNSSRVSPENSGPLAKDFTVSTGPDSSFSLSEHTGEVVVLYFSFAG